MTSFPLMLMAAILLMTSEPGSCKMYHAVICEGSWANLNCGYRSLINIHSIYYGRRDSTTCSSGQPLSTLLNTNCSAPTDTAKYRCIANRCCSIHAGDWEFGDPCRGTYKYLEVTYTCESLLRRPNGIHSVTCEDSVAQLECGYGRVLLILNAEYGRNDRTTCSSGQPSYKTQNTCCSLPNLQVAQRCNGKHCCAIRASNWEFGDPCFGTHKYLEVTYTCHAFGQRSDERYSVTCEDSVAHLKCGEGQVLSIHRADYGRHDKTICTSTRPSLQTQYTCCSGPTGKVAERYRF